MNRIRNTNPCLPFRNGISRIEILVLLGIFAVITALVLPAVQQAREAARRSTCKNNLKMFGLGLHNYHVAWDAFPYGCIGNPSLPPEKRWSWYTFLGHQMAQLGYPAIDQDLAWNDPSARPLLQHFGKHPGDPEFTNLLAYPDLFCPSAPRRFHSDGEPFTDYVGLAGVGLDGPNLPRTSPRAGGWAYETQTTMDDVTDGLSHSLFMMETAKDKGCWLAGGPATVRPYDPSISPAIGEKGQFGGLHPGGGIVLLMDGAVRILADDLDPKVFSAYITIAGGEGKPLEMKGE